MSEGEGRPIEALAQRGGLVQGVPLRTFDALFIAVGRPTALEDTLRQVGYGPEAPGEAYPLSVWRAVCEAVRVHAYDHLSLAEGQRRLGRKLVLGSQFTPLGWAVTPALSELEPERFMARLSWAVRPWRPDMQVEVRHAGFRDYRLEVRDPAPLPEVMAGALEFWFMQQRSLVTDIQVEDLASGSFTLRVRW